MRFLVLVFLFTFSFASFNIKKEVYKTNITISKMNTKLDRLVKEIKRKKRNLYYLNRQISSLNSEIKALEKKEKNSNKVLNELNDLKKGYLSRVTEIKNEITDFLSTNYYLNNQEIDNVNDLIYNEIANKVLNIKAEKIAKLTKINKTLNQKIASTNKQISQIIKAQNILKNKKKKLIGLLKYRKKEIASLNRQKQLYKKKLFALIKRQKELQSRLAKLKIIKNTPAKHISYKGIKTIAPLRGKIIKRFGSYVDPIYNMRIKNDSITIKPYQKNAIVRAIMPGKVIFIGKGGDKKVIIIKHKGKIFSIYANLSKISPLLKKGSYVRKGQIIARVSDSLEFEITYKEKPIDPLKLITLR